MPIEDDKLKSSIEKMVELTLPTQRVGNLGMSINNRYYISDPNDGRYFFVRFDSDGTYTRALHNGRISPVPDLPVRVEFSVRDNANVIAGVAAEYTSQYSGGDYSGHLSVGPHTHQRGSPLAFPIDLRLMLTLQIRPTVGQSLSIMPGFVTHNNRVRAFYGGTIDLASSSLPAEGEHRLVALGIDMSTTGGVVVFLNGTSIALDTAFTVVDLDNLMLFWTETYIPVGIVRIYNGQQRIEEEDIWAFQFLPRAPVMGGTGGPTMFQNIMDESAVSQTQYPDLLFGVGDPGSVGNMIYCEITDNVADQRLEVQFRTVGDATMINAYTTTFDDTPTVLYEEVVPEEYGWHIRARIRGHAGASMFLIGEVTIFVVRPLAADPVILGTPVIVFEHNTAYTPEITVDLDLGTSSIQILVTGSPSDTWGWDSLVERNRA